MPKKILVHICLYSIALYVIFSTPTNASNNQQENNNLSVELERRLKSLEPHKPITLLKSPEQRELEGNYPSKTLSISEVIRKGTKIPFNKIKNEPNYERPVYQEQWHSTYGGGRWSYIPSRIYYAQHRIFPTYDIGLSGLFNFEHHLGIGFPTFQNETDLDLYMVVFQTNVIEVYTKGNQVVVRGTPKRNGVEVITIKTKDIHPTDLKKLLLIQLATNTYELDYSLIKYEAPDFWQKQMNQDQTIRLI